jgi:hypothetical protein
MMKIGWSRISPTVVPAPRPELFARSFATTMKTISPTTGI